MKGERFYGQAYDHLHSEIRDENLWAWCLAQHGMDEQRAAATYIKKMAALIEQEEDYLLQEFEERQLLAEAEREREEENVRLAKLKESEEERREHEAMRIKKEESTLFFIRPSYGLVLFSVIGYLRSKHEDSGTFGMVLLIVLTAIFGASVFTIVRCIFVQGYRPMLQNDYIPLPIIFISAGISGLLLYYFIW